MRYSPSSSPRRGFLFNYKIYLLAQFYAPRTKLRISLKETLCQVEKGVMKMDFNIRSTCTQIMGKLKRETREITLYILQLRGEPATISTLIILLAVSLSLYDVYLPHLTKLSALMNERDGN